MKTVMKFAGFLALVFFSIKTNAQKIKTIEGDLSVLKNETTINIEFLYDGMSVGSYADEKDYIKKKTQEYNAKEPGRGDSWAKLWVSDRALKFEPKFIDLFEEHSGMTVKKNAKYTMIFKTTTTEPGYYVYISKKNAEIDAEVTIVETADRTKTIAVISLKNAPGRTFAGADWATGDRIAESYAVSGKKLAKYIK